MTRRNMRKQSGFSLIEIMVVLIIIGMLAAGVGVNFLGQTDEARIQQTTTDFSNIEKALSMYKLHNYKYPTNEQGLEALRERPEEARQWQDGGYLTKEPVDPWGNPYVYVVPGESRPYDLYSLGADGKSGGEGIDKDIYMGQQK